LVAEKKKRPVRGKTFSSAVEPYEGGINLHRRDRTCR